MKRLLRDFQNRFEQDPDGGRIANLYRHALLALQANPLMSALYRRDSRILGDFLRRQDVSRYTSRLMLGQETVEALQTAGLLRADIRPGVITYLFSVIALGFINIGALIPEASAPSMETVTSALTELLDHGLALQGTDSASGKQALQPILELLRQQYENQPADRKA